MSPGFLGAGFFICSTAAATGDETHNNVETKCQEWDAPFLLSQARFSLPKDIKRDGISASMKDGVLVIVVEKQGMQSQDTLLIPVQ